MATKLRAFYQRRKGRDLFDLATALKSPAVDPARVVEAFLAYMASEKGAHRGALFERNLEARVRMAQFSADLGPMLAAGYEWDVERAREEVSSRLVALLPGEPWRRDE